MTNLWFLEPALKGRYPEALAFLPESVMDIRANDLEKMRAPLDFSASISITEPWCRPPAALERLAHAQQWLFPVKMAEGEQGPKTDIGWEFGRKPCMTRSCASRAISTAQ